MRISIPWLLDLIPDGNAAGNGPLSTDERNRDLLSIGRGTRFGAVWNRSRSLTARNKTNHLLHCFGAKLIVIGVWTETGRPFMM